MEIPTTIHQKFKIVNDKIFPYTFCVYKNAGKTFSSDLRKPCLKTGESLSPPTKLILFKRKITFNIFFVLSHQTVWYVKKKMELEERKECDAFLARHPNPLYYKTVFKLLKPTKYMVI